MPDFDVTDADFEGRVRASFARQRLMATLGATLTSVAAGEVEIVLPFREDLTQQHGYLHAGAVTAIVDSACGYAAMTLTPPGSEVLSIEFKINLVSPAKGELIVARARVVRAGRNITVCAGDAFSRTGAASEKLVATMLATMTVVRASD
ncbi:MAG: PaaI family thioesterase [Pyrinomonadaceae bacterium]